MSQLFLQLLLCTKNKFLATSTLMSLLMFVFECILAGNFGGSKLLLRVNLNYLMFKLTHSGLYSALAWLNLFSWIFCFLLQNKLFVPSNLCKRLHSWYCAKLDQPKLN